MKNIFGIHYKNGSQEELLPDFGADFPYIASYCELDKYFERKVPWHWHKEVEFFYIEKGVLEYYTPKGKTVFPAGSGGFVNSSVLHMTKPPAPAPDKTPSQPNPGAGSGTTGGSGGSGGMTAEEKARWDALMDEVGGEEGFQKDNGVVDW